ncbi:hypothetical protein HWV62_38120 [Athelia sp. TMB]|nr:hypothetical protein HWV62_38120 [Athelia sp. TMB]
MESPSTTPLACLDIRYCRQISDIVIGCLTTIFACTWINRIALAVVALLLPEVSVTLAGKEMAQLEAISAMVKNASHRDVLVVEDGLESTEKDTILELEGHLAKTESREPMITLPISARQSILRSKWTRAHSFFVQMGGFYLYQDGLPIRPLSAEDMALLVWRGYMPPSAEDIEDRSKGDWLSKVVALLQTFWFIAQCIARGTQHLAITQLEVVTLSYCAINIIVYLCWWHKPLNIERPIPVDIALFLDSVPDDFCRPREQPITIWQKIAHEIAVEWHGRSEPVIGSLAFPFSNPNKDRRPPNSNSPTDLCRRAFTFFHSAWTGSWKEIRDSDAYWLTGRGIVFLIFYVVGLVFGALHFIAWSDTFPSHTQRALWRVCTIILVAIPPMAPVVKIYLSTPLHIPRLEKLTKKVLVLSAGMLALAYLFARVATIVISLTTLGYLEASATQSVQWTAFIPHF